MMHHGGRYTAARNNDCFVNGNDEITDVQATNLTTSKVKMCQRIQTVVVTLILLFEVVAKSNKVTLNRMIATVLIL